jgi:hypothetical protein
MSTLRFDPITYQFYYRCRAEEGEQASAAGFRWDPIRRRYCTEDPGVCGMSPRGGDSYVRQLLAEVIGSASQSRRNRRPEATEASANCLLVDRRPLMRTAVLRSAGVAPAGSGTRPLRQLVRVEQVLDLPVTLSAARQRPQQSAAE